MTVKLFVLGLPGSGKSTLAREITKYIDKLRWKSIHINDYVILKQMFYDDVKCKQFKPANRGGFDIVDLNAFDTALKTLEKAIKQYILHAIPKEVILIEFSRNDYLKAFQQFNQDFLQDAFFIYLDTDVKTCKQRILDRIDDPIYEDDYNVSEYIFEKYYNKDDGRNLVSILEKECQIHKQQIQIFDNNCSKEGVLEKIIPFIDSMVNPEATYVDVSAQPEELHFSHS